MSSVRASFGHGRSVLAAVVGFCLALALPAVTQAGDGSSLSLITSLASVGYVGVTVTGVPGTSVQVSEQTASGTTPVGTVQLSASGTGTLPHALTWRCDVRQRTLVASALAPATSASATATVTTPACAGRMAVTIGRGPRAGGSISVGIRDRWGIGSIALSVCSTPPGGGRACARVALGAGQRRLLVRLTAPRPGGWQLSVRDAYGLKRTILRWVAPRYGRLRLLAAGDSEMQILDGLLAQDLAPHGVSVTSDARISTSLSNPSFFNWPAHAAHQAPTLRPDVTVVFIGGNEGFAVPDGGTEVNCCSAAWSAGYADLVAEMMRIYLRGNAGRVYWFVLPTPRRAALQSVFTAVNAGIRAAAARFPGRVGLIDAGAFFTPGNRYRNYMTYHGHGFTIHEPDGVHLSTPADVIDAQFVVRRLIADHVIR